MLKDRNTPEDVARMENLEELTRAVAESMEAGETFTDFLDAAALVSDFLGRPYSFKAYEEWLNGN